MAVTSRTKKRAQRALSDTGPISTTSPSTGKSSEHPGFILRSLGPSSDEEEELAKNAAECKND